MEVQNNEVMVTEDGFTGQLTQRTTQYCSMVPKTDEDRIVLYNAINAPDKRLSDMVNMDIEVQHVFAETVTILREDTGELQPCPRLVFIDKDGVSYGCLSFGVFSSVKKLFQVFGQPDTWKKPLKLRVNQIIKGEKRFLSLTVTFK